MADGTITITALIGGKNLSKSIVKAADHPNPYIDVPLPAGKTVTDWVKTDADTAACNLPAGHGYSTGKMDVYWTESGVPKQRHNVDGTVAVNALSLDGGTGDDFPASATTGVVVNVQVSITVQCDGDAIKMMVVLADFTPTTFTEATEILHFCGVDLLDSGPATVKHFHLPPNEPVVWWQRCSYANPVTGNVIEDAKASNGSATYAAVLSILFIEDATP
jgi:hypothetical protein